MARTRSTYPQEFRQQMIGFVQSGHTPEELPGEFEPSSQTIRNCVTQTDIDVGRREGSSTAERKELRRLRRENKRLHQEPDILAKAAAWFAQETDTVPPKSSGS